MLHSCFGEFFGGVVGCVGSDVSSVAGRFWYLGVWGFGTRAFRASGSIPQPLGHFVWVFVVAQGSVGALIIRVGSWGRLYNNYNKEPPK